MKRIIVSAAIIALSSGLAFAQDGPYQNPDNADITVKDTSSREFLKNQGYSDEAARIIEVKTKHPLTPIPVVEKKENFIIKGLKKVGWRVLDTVDPTVDNKNFADHNIRFDGVTVEDL